MVVRMRSRSDSTRQPFNVIECKLMRVGEMEGSARGAPFCKKIFFLFSVKAGVRVRKREEVEQRIGREEKRVETLLQSELEHIVIRHS
jgi:hypothetical protein